MNCKEIIELLGDFCGGELAAERCASIEQHFCCCPSCLACFESYQITIKLSRRLTCKPLPDQLAAKLHAVVEAMRQESGDPSGPRNC